jgi:chromosome partitioning protein
MTAVVICAGSHKGGTGRSSLIRNLAAEAAAAGKLTLIVDLDPHSGMCVDLGIYGSEVDDRGEELASALIDARKPEVISEVKEHLDVLVSGPLLSPDAINAARQGCTDRGEYEYSALYNILAPLARNYEFIFVDTPPGDAILQNFAFAASDFIISPTRSDWASVKSIGELGPAIHQAQKFNPSLKLAGVVLFGVNTQASKINSRTRTEIEQGLSGIAPVFTNTIRYSEATAVECRALGLSAGEYVRLHDAKTRQGSALNRRRDAYVASKATALASDYRMLTIELLSRLTELRALSRAKKE